MISQLRNYIVFLVPLEKEKEIITYLIYLMLQEEGIDQKP